MERKGNSQRINARTSNVELNLMPHCLAGLLEKDFAQYDVVPLRGKNE